MGCNRLAPSGVAQSMPLYCSMVNESRLVIVRGLGKVTRSDIAEYLAQTLREGVKAYGKLILMGDSTMVLTSEELDEVADSLVAYARGQKPGPVAFVAGNPINLDMIVLLKQRVGGRPFSIFIDAREAAQWLEGFSQPPAVSRIAPEGSTLPDHPGSTNVVASSWETIAGPETVSPAPKVKRS
jgi:hypothetical protein